MTYKKFEKLCLFYGFTQCPLSAEEYKQVLALGILEDDLYGIACDVDNGFTLEEAIEAAILDKGSF